MGGTLCKTKNINTVYVYIILELLFLDTCKLFVKETPLNSLRLTYTLHYIHLDCSYLGHIVGSLNCLVGSPTGPEGSPTGPVGSPAGPAGLLNDPLGSPTGSEGSSTGGVGSPTGPEGSPTGQVGLLTGQICKAAQSTFNIPYSKFSLLSFLWGITEKFQANYLLYIPG